MNTLKTVEEVANQIMKDFEVTVEHDATQWNGMLVWEAGDADTVHNILSNTLTQDRQATADVLCALLEEKKRQPTMHQIPCPDNMPGCCVYHCEERLSDVDTIHNQALSLAQDIIRATLSNKHV